VFGASGEIIPEAKQWNVAFSFRGLKADDHYNGVNYQHVRKQDNTYVINQQRIYDLTVGYTVTRRLNFSLSVPYIDSSWAVPTPLATSGVREEQNGRGLGDISVSGRFWLFNPEKHSTGNFSVGVGCKMPTGDSDATDIYPDLLTGANNDSKAVDMSAQPGDGGWGITLELQGYKKVGRALFYGYGNYLSNPRDTNQTDSIIVGLGFGANPAYQDLLKNSVTDSYVLRAGSVIQIHGGLSGSIGLRMEGLPRYDIIGDSHGWRRPGYETFYEPGLIYTRGKSSWSLHVPFALKRNRQANPYTGTPGDSTFPDYIVLAGYSYAFDALGQGSRAVSDAP
jgi:hypothetical protein